MTCPPEHRHESTCYQVHSCRCDRCREWRRNKYWQEEPYERKKRYLAGTDVMFPARPSMLRLQALARNGWGSSDLAELTGLHYRPLIKIRAGNTRFIRLSTMRKINAVYREKAMTVNRTRTGKITSTRARNNGWPSPLDLDEGDLR